MNNRKIIYNMQFRIIEDSKKIVIYYIPSLKNELVDLSAFKEVLFLNRSEIEEKVIEECVNSVFKQIINKNKSSMQYYLNPDDLKSLLNRLIGEVPHILILSRDEIRRLLFDLYTIHNDQKLTLKQKIIN